MQVRSATLGLKSFGTPMGVNSFEAKCSLILVYLCLNYLKAQNLNHFTSERPFLCVFSIAIQMQKRCN